MDKPAILHILSPLPHVSPFDITMAYDAGFDAVIPYANVALEQISGLVQDVIFPRSPKDLRRSAILVGGRDAGIAMDMVDAAKEAMVPPFEVSILADPSGAFTTAAAVVACVERQLRQHHQMELKGPASSSSAVPDRSASRRESSLLWPAPRRPLWTIYR